MYSNQRGSRATSSSSRLCSYHIAFTSLFFSYHIAFHISHLQFVLDGAHVLAWLSDLFCVFLLCFRISVVSAGEAAAHRQPPAGQGQADRLPPAQTRLQDGHPVCVLTK